jgi:hypothetical protein
MRTTTAYFAGVGTVAAAIAAGLGGGLLFANMIAPHEPKYAAEPTKLEQRMAARTIPITAPSSEPAPSPAAPPPAATAQVVETAPAAEPRTANNAPAAQPPVAAPPSLSPAEQAAAREPATAPREAFAKARDADIKRATTEKRRSERREQWADKRRTHQPREKDLEAVEQAVRDDTEPRQAFASEPVKLEMPRIKLFGDD